MTESAPVADSAAPADLSAHDELSIDEAMGIYANSEPKPIEGEEGAEDDAAISKELASKEADADPEEATSEETNETDPEENLPPIERPRSWAKELDEEWASYPREAQERIAKREQERDAAIRRSQNEAAEIRKAADAERMQAEQARKDYESKLPALVKSIENNLQQDFGDIRSIEDVRKLQSEDPFRFQQWQLRQMELSAAQAEQKQASERLAKEEGESWSRHIQEENSKFAEYAPEFSDPKKAQELTAKAVDRLHDLGFTDEQLNRLASGKEKLSIYDHRVQRLLFDNIKFSEAKVAPAKAAPKNLPPVLKPGAAKPPGAQNQATIQNLTRQLESTGSVDDAYALFEAQNRRASR